MEDRHLDQLAVAFAKGVSRRQVFKTIVGAASAGILSRLGIPQSSRAALATHSALQGPSRMLPLLAAAQPETTPPPAPGDYCRNTEGVPPQPVDPPTPFLYQPFAFPPDASVDFGTIWAAQMDHATPTYRRDGGLFTLGERLAYNVHRDEQDPDGPLQGGTKVYLKDGYREFDYTVAPEEITRETGSTIFAYESPAIEDYLFYDGHDGHDFAVTGDALAASAGTVSFAGDSGTPLGRVVEIAHPEGYLTRYAHLASIAVEVGQSIDVPGVPVGQIGGSATIGGVLQDGFWGTHLHFSAFHWNEEIQGWQITDPFGWDPWKSPGEQTDDPLVACNGEVSYNLWFGWWPRAYGEAADAAILSARPTDGRYLGGSLADEAIEQASTPESSLSPADLSVYEVVGRAQAAVQQAGTYKYERIDLDESGEQSYAQTGEVVIGGSRKFQGPNDTSWTYVDESGKFYTQQEDGTWTSNFPGGGPVADWMTEFLGAPVTDWSLLGADSTEGRSAYQIQRISTEIQGAIEYQYQETYWIDAETFLPLEQVSKNVEQEQTSAATEVHFSDFGASVDAQVPAEALAPTPTPEPTPPPINPEALDPEALFNLLLTSPFPDNEMPLGYGVDGIFDVSGEDLPRGAMSGVRVVTDKAFGMATDDIHYYIFATADDAARGSEEVAALYQRTGLFSYGPAAGFGFSATQLGGSFSASFIGTGTISVVIVQVGNVVVTSMSYALPDAQAQADTNAADLATAGVQHLVMLVGGPAAQEADAAVQATREAAARETEARSAESLLTTSAGAYTHVPGEGVSVPVDVENADASEHIIQIAVELNLYADEGPVSSSSWNLIGTAEAVVPAGTTVTVPVLLDKTSTSVPTEAILQYFREYPPDVVRNITSYIIAIDGFTVRSLPPFRTS
jgi:murein DD-endopeptidase MepM/ murein hydrolase activator NlpD